MITKKEYIPIIVSIALFTLLLTYNNEIFSFEKIPLYLILSTAIILISIFAKKIAAKKIHTEIEHKIWEFQRYWFSKGSHLRHPVLIGFFLPALLGFLSGGAIKFLTFLEFNSKELPGKATKRFGIKRFSTMLEWDDARIGFFGLVAVMALAIIAKFLISFQAFPFIELSKYALYFAIYNIIPFSTLDGMKILMGSRPLYIFSLGLLILTGLVVFF
ncbi:MAG: hypothetical protein AABX17_02190 [Nanoarchaeota archaeon]|mgnify:CR=1 FL=1